MQHCGTKQKTVWSYKCGVPHDKDLIDMMNLMLWWWWNVLLWLVFMVLVQWIPELRHYAPSVPIILVGTKLGMFIHSVSLPLLNMGGGSFGFCIINTSPPSPKAFPFFLGQREFCFFFFLKMFFLSKFSAALLLSLWSTVSIAGCDPDNCEHWLYTCRSPRRQTILCWPSRHFSD